VAGRDDKATLFLWREREARDTPTTGALTRSEDVTMDRLYVVPRL
jgi:hypothetical protein